jgi:hypothetical protein
MEIDPVLLAGADPPRPTEEKRMRRRGWWEKEWRGGALVRRQTERRTARGWDHLLDLVGIWRDERVGFGLANVGLGKTTMGA